MHQSVVETGTGICKDIRQARQEISELRGELNGLAKRKVNRKAVSRKPKAPTRAEREAMLAASVGVPTI